MTVSSNTPATETKKAAVNAATSDLAERIAKSLTIDTTTFLVTPTTPIYNEAAEAAGVTQEAIASVKNFESTFVAATTKAIGEIGIRALESHADANRVSGEIPMYEGDSFSVSVDRHTTGRNMQTGKPIDIYGSVRTSFSQTTGANRGQMSKVRLGLRDLADEALNKNK